MFVTQFSTRNENKRYVCVLLWEEYHQCFIVQGLSVQL